MSRESADRHPSSAHALAREPEERPIDNVPDHVREAARRAFAFRDRNAQVLGLVTDTLVDGSPETGEARRLAFAGAGLAGQVLVTVLEDADVQRVTLVVECPWEDGSVVGVTVGDAAVTVAQQAPGRWAAGPVEHGLVRVVLRKDDRALHTAWVRV